MAHRAHSRYGTLCVPCGEMQLARRNQHAELAGRVALVTGARVGIGFATALRLLRDDATVVAVTRFPHDAARRYAAESDFARWSARLRIYRLDLRELPSVERFAEQIGRTFDRLDIVINNAAQTIRRPPAFYDSLARFEQRASLPRALQALLGDATEGDTVAPVPPALLTTQPMSGGPGWRMADHTPSAARIADIPTNNTSGETEDAATTFPPGLLAPDGQQLDLRPTNSWMLRDDEVCAVEALEALAINATAPFLLTSRLKPLLARNAMSPNLAGRFVVNVTSAEGQFSGGVKPVRHPHTNMAKAALNMFTHTCARDYARIGIYMNAVDPGWVSFQHPYPAQAAMKARGDCPPYDGEDAAARICDPIYAALNGAPPVWGTLLKDYEESPW